MNATADRAVFKLGEIWVALLTQCLVHTVTLIGEPDILRLDFTLLRICRPMLKLAVTASY